MEAVFTNEESTQIKWTNGQGQVWSVPYPLVDGEISRAVQEWLDQGNSIVPYAPPPPTAADVEVEADRRVNLISGAESVQKRFEKQLFAQMRASELINKRSKGQALTAEEQAEEAALEALAAAIKTLRAREAALKAMDPIPADYTDDSYWI